MRAFLQRLNAGALIVGVLTAAFGWFLHQFAFGSGLVNLSYDLLHVGRLKHVPQPAEVLVVYLDEKSHEELNQPRNKPWDRALHARFIDRLTGAGAKAVVMDIVFSDPGLSPEVDRLLAAAIQRNGRVILGADRERIGPSASKFVPPTETLLDVAAGIGSVELWPSRDLIVRRHTPEEQLPSLSLATLQVLRKTEGLAVSEGPAEAWIHYYGAPGWLPSASYADVVSGRLPDSALSNKVVFVGARILTKLQYERKDEYRNPYSFWLTDEGKAFISGVDIHATMFLNGLRGDWLRRVPGRFEIALLFVFGMAVGFALMRVRPIPAVLIATLTLALVAVLSRELFLRKHIWFPLLIPAVQVAFALAISVAVNSVRLYVENRMFTQSLELYLSPKLVKKFARNRDRKLLQPGAEKQVITVLFSDIANFTSLSEGMDSDELATLMNSYFQGAVADCIHATDGTVVKYIGDAIFAFWNAPEAQRDHTVRACRAALRFRELAKKPIQGRLLVTRIGLHTGVANVGNFGSATRFDYTAFGETVNLASRLEGLNRFLGTEVLITAATKKEAGDRFVTRRLGDFKLKGFEKAVTVFELISGKADEEKTRVLRDEFAYALQLFQTRDWLECESAFRRILDHSPKDGPTLFYLKELETIRANPPVDEWQGVVELREK